MAVHADDRHGMLWHRAFGNHDGIEHSNTNHIDLASVPAVGR